MPMGLLRHVKKPIRSLVLDAALRYAREDAPIPGSRDERRVAQRLAGAQAACEAAQRRIVSSEASDAAARAVGRRLLTRNRRCVVRTAAWRIGAVTRHQSEPVFGHARRCS